MLRMNEILTPLQLIITATAGWDISPRDLVNPHDRLGGNPPDDGIFGRQPPNDQLGGLNIFGGIPHDDN